MSLLAGTGIEFRSFDGKAIDATQLIIAPGIHSVEFRVRRNLRRVSEDLDGVFHVGECKLDIDAAESGFYRIMLVNEFEVESGAEVRTQA